jgi:hypothetical protein
LQQTYREHDALWAWALIVVIAAVSPTAAAAAQLLLESLDLLHHIFCHAEPLEAFELAVASVS